MYHLYYVMITLFSLGGVRSKNLRRLVKVFQLINILKDRDPVTVLLSTPILCN